jgi:hypothetical protein
MHADRLGWVPGESRRAVFPEVDVTVERVIARPRAVVAAFAVDPARAPEWYENIKASTAAAAGRGVRARVRRAFLGDGSSTRTCA